MLCGVFQFNMTLSFSQEPRLYHESSEPSIVERARKLQQESAATTAELGTLKGTMQYAFAMTSEHSSYVSPEAQEALDKANALEVRCRDIRHEIEDLFNA
jgi:hypothetical protein